MYDSHGLAECGALVKRSQKEMALDIVAVVFTGGTSAVAKAGFAKADWPS